MKNNQPEMVIRLYVLILLALISNGCSNKVIKTIQKQIDGVEAEFVPDKRTGITNVSVEKVGRAKLMLSGESLYPEGRERIIEMTAKTGFQVIDSIIVLPETSLDDMTWGLVTVSVANIRSRPSHPAELSTQAVLGTPVRILKNQSGWLLIQTPDNYLGWTNTSSVQPTSFSGLKNWNNSDRLIFGGLHGSIISESGSGKIVSDLVAGAIVEKLSENETNYIVRLPDGRYGKVEKTGFTPFSKWAEQINATHESVISTALKFSGLPYLWGGTSSKALDCSGFTKTVYFLNGLIIERDASQQINHGMKVSPENRFEALQQGDLLFYGNKEPFRVVHVGFWMGGTEVIHASGMVKVESMDNDRENFSDYLYDTFLGEVRRVIGYDNGQGIVKVREHPWYF